MNPHAPKDDIAAKIAQYIESERDNLIAFTRDLIEIQSLTGQEQAVCQRAAKEMEICGFDEVGFDAVGSVWGRIGSGPREILYDAHLDTVDADAANWTTDPYSAVIKDGKLFGRGAVDDKGPFATLVYGAKALKALGLDKDFTLYVSGGVAEEESEGLALEILVKEKGLQPEFVLVSEASELKIRRGHRGRALLEANFIGVPVHASIHEQGDNPIEKALPFAAAIAELDQRLPVDTVLGRGDICVTRIDCDSISMNTVPSGCKVIMDRRLVPGDTQESVLAELQALPGADQADIRFIPYADTSYNGYLKEVDEYFPGWILEEDHPLIQRAVRCYQGILGGDAAVDVWGFSTNGTYSMGAAGIPTVGFGPGDGALAHRDNEFVPLEDLVQAAKFNAYLPLVVEK